MFVTIQDFDIPPFNLPNLMEVQSTFEAFVDREEAGILIKLLGLQFYQALVEGLATLPPEWEAGSYAIGEEVVYGSDIFISLIDDNTAIPSDGLEWQQQGDNRWAKLRYGNTYQIMGGSPVFWNGLKDMLVPYMFYRWQNYSIDNVSAVGIVVANTENSHQSPPGARLVEAWITFCYKANRMFGLTGNLYEYLYYSGTTFQDIVENLPTYLKSNWKWQYPDELNEFNL